MLSSKNILCRIEKRLRKVESKIADVKDQYEETNSNIEDLYDTVNNLKSPDSYNKYTISSSSSSTSSSSSSTNHSTKKLKKINNNNSLLDQTQISTFINHLTINQPQLNTQELDTHTNYYINLPDNERSIMLDKIKDIEKITTTNEPKFFKIINSTLDTYYKKIALCKLQTIETMKQKDTSASDYFKLSQWLDTFLEIPFNIYKTPSYMDINITINNLNASQYLLDSRQHLDTVIYGQDKTKQHIIEILARMIQNPKTLGSVFAIYGEAGTGKTTLIKDGLSHIFGLPFIFISLGGAQDRATLAGSNYVYEGSTCGKIIQSLKQSQCMNPIFYFDELDKTSGTEKGMEIINLLIHLTDYTQNSHFMDDYMDGIAVNLSRATFIFSFNDKSKISPILLDRMEIIKFNSYSDKEKIVIARDFLLPSVVKNVFNDDNIKVVISDENLERVVCSYRGLMKKRLVISRCKFGKIMKKVSSVRNGGIKNVGVRNGGVRNGGVRYIKKILERIVSRVNLQLFQKKPCQKQDLKNKLIVSDKIVNEVLSNK